MPALSRAGVLKFVGSGMTVFRASSATAPGHVVEARALVKTRLPEPTLGRARDTLLRELHARGAAKTPDRLLRVDPPTGGFPLFPHLTVEENLVEAPVSVLKRPRTEAVEQARRLLDRVGLADKAGAYPAVCPADSSSAWPSRGSSPWSRSCSSSTNRPPLPTPSWSVKSSTS